MSVDNQWPENKFEIGKTASGATRREGGQLQFQIHIIYFTCQNHCIFSTQNRRKEVKWIRDTAQHTYLFI